MTAVLVSTLPTFATLAAAIETAVEAHELELVASGAPFLASMSWGVVAIDAAGRAVEATVVARGSGVVAIV